MSSGKSGRAVAPGDFAAEHGADGAVNIANGHAERDGRAAFEGFLAHLDQFAVERVFQAVILSLRVAPADVARHGRIVKDGGKIDALGLPVGDVGALLQAVDAADHLVHGAEAKLGHDLSQVLGDEEEEVDDVLRLPGKLLAQLGILGGDAHRAGVQVALAHHDAAHGHERRGREAELFGAQQRGDGHVAAGLQLAVHLQAHAAAQVVEYQHLLRFGQAQSPRGCRRGESS